MIPTPTQPPEPFGPEPGVGAHQIRVGILAASPLDEAGVVNLLSRPTQFSVQPLSSLVDGDVLVVAASKLTGLLLKQIRDVSAGRDICFAAVLGQLGDVDLLTAIECGLRGVIWRRQVTAERFASLIDLVAAGEAQLPAEVQSRLLRDLAELQRTVLLPRGLTSSGLEVREVRVLELLAEGLDTLGIAEEMGCSERTVKSVISGLLNRFQLRNRTHAVAHAFKLGVL